MYLTYDEYVNMINGADLPVSIYSRFEWKARKILDDATMTADGVAKLKSFFPTDEDSIYAVKMTMLELIGALYQDDRKSAVVTYDDGTVSSMMRRSVSSGSESISFGEIQTGDKASMKAGYMETVKEGLSGAVDANGVSLLYAGVYPRWAHV